MNLLIDLPSLALVRFFRIGHGRAYYLTEPPVLGILVIRFGSRIEELRGLVVDAALGHEQGIDGWCVAGFSGHRHGKATFFKVSNAPVTTLSAVIGEWRQRYPMR